MATPAACFTHFVDPKFAGENATPSSSVPGNAKLSELLSSGDWKKLKEFVRTGNWSPGDPIRQQLWAQLCLRHSSKRTSVYSELRKECADYDGDEAKLPAFVDATCLQRYHMTQDGGRAVAQLVYVLGRSHPEVTFSPHLYNIVCLLLHYVSEDQAYSCVEALLTAQPMCIHQTRMAFDTSALVFRALLKRHAKKTYDWLRQHGGGDLDALLNDWLLRMFRDLPFIHLVRVMDCYLSEGMKVLYRVAIAILILFHKHHASKSSHLNSISDRLTEFYGKDMAAIAIQILLKTSFGIRGMSRKEVQKLARKKEMYVQSVHHSRALQADLPDGLVPASRDSESRSRSFEVDEVNSSLLTSAHWDSIWRWIPERVTLLVPKLLFSSDEHGCSLTTFYHNISDREENPATLLVIKTTAGEVFGAYCSTDWEERLQQDKLLSFFGTGETFVFSLVPQPVKYPWVGVGKREQPPGTACLFMAGDQKQIMIGAGGGGIALSLDQELHFGRTEISQTFENQPLASDVNFTAAVVEVFGFISA